MTIRDEVMAMTPEQLRVEIAMRRGYPFPYDKYQVPVPTPITFTAPREVQPTVDFRIEFRDVPNWPADISAAWKLVENLLENNISFDLLDISSVPDRFLMNIRHRGCSRLITWAEAGTAPLAISRAWLIWKKEEAKDLI